MTNNMLTLYKVDYLVYLGGGCSLTAAANYFKNCIKITQDLYENMTWSGSVKLNIMALKESVFAQACEDAMSLQESVFAKPNSDKFAVKRWPPSDEEIDNNIPPRRRPRRRHSLQDQGQEVMQQEDQAQNGQQEQIEMHQEQEQDQQQEQEQEQSFISDRTLYLDEEGYDQTNRDELSPISRELLEPVEEVSDDEEDHREIEKHYMYKFIKE